MKTLFVLSLWFATGLAQAGTVYLCRAYNGASFWSSAHCSQHNALIDRMEQVADGLSWDQQVQQAQHGISARSRQAANDSGEAQRAVRCGQLINERTRIEARYTNWQWQPPEVINPDQQRMRGLRAELSANGCRSQ